MAETLVEGMGKHQLSLDHEVAGVEMHERALPALLGLVHWHTLLLVDIAQRRGLALAHDISAIGQQSSVFLHPALHEVVRWNGHVAVHKQQPLVTGLSCQEITDGSTTHVLLTTDKADMGKSG